MNCHEKVGILLLFICGHGVCGGELTRLEHDMLIPNYDHPQDVSPVFVVFEIVKFSPMNEGIPYDIMI